MERKRGLSHYILEDIWNVLRTVTQVAFSDMTESFKNKLLVQAVFISLTVTEASSV